MSQYLTRTLPVISAKAGNAIVEGQIVKFSGTDVVTPITADTDVFIGVALNTVDSASNATVALRGSGAQCLGKICGTVIAGQSLYPSGSAPFAGYFQTSSLYPYTPTGSQPVTAYALEPGVANDLIRVALTN